MAEGSLEETMEHHALGRQAHWESALWGEINPHARTMPSCQFHSPYEVHFLEERANLNS